MAAGVLLLCAYAIALSTPAVGLYPDDGVYVVTAKALAEGEGYRIISLPETVAQTKYPILFPLLLSAVWTLSPDFPENLLLLKVVPFAAFLGWLILAFRLLRRELTDARVALGCMVLCAASPWVFFLSTSLLSETFFALLLWGTLLLLRQFDREQLSEQVLIGAAMLGAAAFLTRTIGVVLPLTALLLLLKRRSIGPAARFVLYSSLLAAPWLLWVWLNRGGDGGTTYYTITNYADWNVLTGFDWIDKVLVVLTNAGQILTAPALLMGWSTWAAQPLLILVSAFAILGFAARLRKGLDAISLFLILYCGVLLLWAWRPVRFLTPVLPLLLALAWMGARVAFGYLRVPRNGRRFAVLSIAGLLLVNAGFVIGQETFRAQRSGVVCPPHEECTLHWRHVEDVADWIRNNTDAEARLIAHHDPMIFLLTGRRAARAATFDPVRMLYRDPRSALDDIAPCYLVERMRAVEAEFLVETPTGRALEEWLLAALVARSDACEEGSLEEIRGDWGSGVRLHRLRD